MYQTIDCPVHGSTPGPMIDQDELDDYLKNGMDCTIVKGLNRFEVSCVKAFGFQFVVTYAEEVFGKIVDDRIERLTDKECETLRMLGATAFIQINTSFSMSELNTLESVDDIIDRYVKQTMTMAA